MFSHQFGSIEAMLDLLSTTLPSWEGGTAVLAGHYRVAMEHGVLREVLWSPEILAASMGHLHLGLLEMGTFPQQSLLYGTSLLRYLPPDSRIWVLCNDTLRRFGALQEGLPASLYAIRHAYYHDVREKWFLRFLREQDLEASNIIHFNSAKRAAEDLLTSEAPLFSERAFENRFGVRLRRRWVLKPGDAATYLATLVEIDQKISLKCGVGAECHCSRSTAELLLQMKEAGYQNALLFIPEACREAVTQTVKLIWEQADLFEHVLIVFSGKRVVNQQTGEIDFPSGVHFFRGDRPQKPPPE